MPDESVNPRMPRPHPIGSNSDNRPESQERRNHVLFDVEHEEGDEKGRCNMKGLPDKLRTVWNGGVGGRVGAMRIADDGHTGAQERKEPSRESDNTPSGQEVRAGAAIVSHESIRHADVSGNLLLHC